MTIDTRHALPTMLYGAVHKPMSAWAYRGKSKYSISQHILDSFRRNVLYTHMRGGVLVVAKVEESRVVF